MDGPLNIHDLMSNQSGPLLSESASKEARNAAREVRILGNDSDHGKHITEDGSHKALRNLEIFTRWFVNDMYDSDYSSSKASSSGASAEEDTPFGQFGVAWKEQEGRVQQVRKEQEERVQRERARKEQEERKQEEDKEDAQGQKPRRQGKPKQVPASASRGLSSEYRGLSSAFKEREIKHRRKTAESARKRRVEEEQQRKTLEAERVRAEEQRRKALEAEKVNEEAESRRENSNRKDAESDRAWSDGAWSDGPRSDRARSGLSYVPNPRKTKFERFIAAVSLEEIAEGISVLFWGLVLILTVLMAVLAVGLFVRVVLILLS